MFKEKLKKKKHTKQQLSNKQQTNLTNDKTKQKKNNKERNNPYVIPIYIFIRMEKKLFEENKKHDSTRPNENIYSPYAFSNVPSNLFCHLVYTFVSCPTVIMLIKLLYLYYSFQNIHQYI